MEKMKCANVDKEFSGSVVMSAKVSIMGEDSLRGATSLEFHPSPPPSLYMIFFYSSPHL